MMLLVYLHNHKTAPSLQRVDRRGETAFTLTGSRFHTEDAGENQDSTHGLWVLKTRLNMNKVLPHH